MHSEELQTRLQHVRFIGGGTGAGKSTVARRLATDHALHLYDAEQFSAYAPRTTPATAPLLHAFLAMDMDERWLNRSPQCMVETFHGFQGELFDLILEDLLALPQAPPVLAEGFTLLPRLVAPLLSGPGQAVWLLPSPEFHRMALESRGSTWDIPSKTSDPVRARANLDARARLFADEVRAQATALHLPVIEVDVGMSVGELVRAVAGVLALPSRSTDQEDSSSGRQNDLVRYSHHALQLHVARLSEKALLRDLLTDYLVEFAALEGIVPARDSDGHVPYRYFDLYWQQPERVPLLLRLGERAVGFCFLRDTGHCWQIAEFYIVPAHRHSGFGSRAVSLVMDFCRRNGRHQALEARVEEYNPRALSFWLSQGFVEQGRQGGRIPTRFDLSETPAGA